MTKWTITLTLVGSPLTARAGVVPPAPVVPTSAIVDALNADTERDPVRLAARIGTNARAVSDRLAERDAGADTRRRQSAILRDLDRLLEQPPPPPSGGGGGGSPPPPSGSPPPPSGGQPPPPSGDGGSPPPSSQGQGKPPPKSWRDQEGQEPAGQSPGRPKPGRGQPGDGQPTGEGQKSGEGQPKSAGQAGGKSPGGGGKPGEPPPPQTAPPAEDAITKQVWGHLPERLRREMNQYYKEQFMPKYSDLLREYYSGLAEQPARPARP